MRIYLGEIDKTVDDIEIYLTKEQAEDFRFRINDMANNPLNKPEELLEDLVSGDIDESGFEVQSLEFCRYNRESIGEYWGERNKMIILFDK